MVKRKKRIELVFALLLLSILLFSMSGTAFAHHAGLNPGVGNLNEEMVHNGLMERAAEMGYWNQPWELNVIPVP